MMIYESTLQFKGKIECINLESDAEYSKITFNQLKFDNPVLNELFTMITSGEVVEVEIKRMVQ
jgi:hypothetical protein